MQLWQLMTVVGTEVPPLSLSLTKSLHPFLCQLTQTAELLGQPRDSLPWQLPDSLCPHVCWPFWDASCIWDQHLNQGHGGKRERRRRKGESKKRDTHTATSLRRLQPNYCCQLKVQRQIGGLSSAITGLCKNSQLNITLKGLDGKASVTKYPLHLGWISIELRAKGSKSV